MSDPKCLISNLVTHIPKDIFFTNESKGKGAIDNNHNYLWGNRQPRCMISPVCFSKQSGLCQDRCHDWSLMIRNNLIFNVLFQQQQKNHTILDLTKTNTE